MNKNYETMIKHLELLSSFDISVDTDFGGNVDDAYEAGGEAAEQRLASYVLAILKENNNKDD